jgi:hypothetical protein
MTLKKQRRLKTFVLYFCHSVWSATQLQHPKGTIRMMIEAGARALAVEADKTLILDLEEVIELANKNNLTITAV